MSVIRDGGPAYPCHSVDGKEEYMGKTLRDSFAEAALEGWRANPNGKYTTYDDAAEEAYRYADAMIRAREKKSESPAKASL